MKLRIFYKRSNWIPFSILAIVALIIQFIADLNPLWMIGTLALIWGALSCQVTLSERGSIIAAAIELVLGPVLTIYSVQYLILEPENFGRIRDEKLLMNMAIAAVLYLTIFLISNRTAIACTISGLLLLLFGFADYFVYQFRGNEIVFSDLKAAKTGLSVAGGYQFTLHNRGALVLLGQMLFLVCIWKLNIRMKKRLQGSVVSALAAALCVIFVACDSAGVNTETWQQKGTYRNGFYLNMVLSIRDSFVKAPKGYSLDVIAELEAEYGRDFESAEQEAVEEIFEQITDDDEKKPTIIVIMNESFCDLSMDGEVRTNIPTMPFIDALEDNTIKGYALSSVYGAKTPNSEWEFLTGNTMAFLPEGSVVYQQFIADDATSLVSTLSNEGYTCVAMHPYYETGWSRNVVYPNLGFDEMYFIDDFPQEDIIREYISDQELYEQMIARYESKEEDEDLFLFSVSMQNHGGYVTTYENFPERVYKIGRSYTDANQYLSLVRESDKAVEYLINYFSDVEDPVEIVFFGDHQPGLTEGFYEILNGKGLSGLTEAELQALYTVPFFVWTNYPSLSDDVAITSLNFLSTYTLNQAGIELTPYERFLSDFEEVIPAINSQGYYSTIDGCYKDISAATGIEAEWILKYQILQYNSMFDSKHKSQVFFPYLDEE